DRALDPVLSKRHERDGSDPALSLFVTFDCDRVRSWSESRLEAAVRSEPDFELPLFGVGWRWNNGGALHVPGVVAADHRYPALLPLERRCNHGGITASDGSALPGSLLLAEILLCRSALVVNGSFVTVPRMRRPIMRRGIILAHRGEIAGGGRILNRPQVLAAHCFQGRLQKGSGIGVLGHSTATCRHK